MLKYIAIIVLVVLAASCGRSNGKTRPAHYTLTDIRTATFLHYLAENDTTQLPYFEKQIIEELKKVEWQVCFFQEWQQDSVYYLNLVDADMNKMRLGDLYDFEILLDSNGNMYRNNNLLSPEQMADEYWSFYCPLENDKTWEIFKNADKKLVKFDDIGAWECSKGFFEMGVILPTSDCSYMKILRSFRRFMQTVFSSYIHYRNQISQKAYELNYCELKQKQWNQVVTIVGFYSIFNLKRFDSSNSEENFRRFY